LNISITGHHMKTTEAIKNYVNKRMLKLERHFYRIHQIHVILTVEGQRRRAEATIHLKGTEVFAHAEDHDLYAAIDLLTDKLDRQVLKYKEQHIRHNDRRSAVS